MPQFGHVEAVACCFCDLPKIPGGQLIAGPRIYICDACIATADAVIETDTPMPTGRIRIPLTTMATIYPVDKASEDLRCSFCGKFRYKVDGMASGDEVWICTECLQRCREALVPEVAEAEDPAADRPIVRPTRR
jgi:ATP-dependent protease Clp ATPase subunit